MVPRDHTRGRTYTGKDFLHQEAYLTISYDLSKFLYEGIGMGMKGNERRKEKLKIESDGKADIYSLLVNPDVVTLGCL